MSLAGLHSGASRAVRTQTPPSPEPAASKRWVLHGLELYAYAFMALDFSHPISQVWVVF